MSRIPLAARSSPAQAGHFDRPLLQYRCGKVTHMKAEVEVDADFGQADFGRYLVCSDSIGSTTILTVEVPDRLEFVHVLQVVIALGLDIKRAQLENA